MIMPTPTIIKVTNKIFTSILGSEGILVGPGNGNGGLILTLLTLNYILLTMPSKNCV